jgi:predicted Zn finger-like uncharacterized protein
MATEVRDDARLTRCPHCRARHRVPDELAYDATVRCQKCDRVFDLYRGLKAQGVPTDSLTPPPVLVEGRELSVLRSVIWPACCLGALWLSSYLIMPGMNGPEFLVFDLVVGLALLIVCTVARHLWRDRWTVSLLGFVAFEGVGLLRFWTSTKTKWEDFSFLMILMAVGGLLFFVRGGKRSGSSDGGWFIGGCGGGCGGGGCGGGGCGGCGGG